MWPDSVCEHYCVDSSQDMNTVARLLLQGQCNGGRWGPFQNLIRCLIIRSCKVSNPRNLV